MAKFSIEWKESVWYITEIEADTAEDARERFENNEYGNIEMVDNTFEGITFIEECVNE